MATVFRASNAEEEKLAQERGLVKISRAEALAEAQEICSMWTPASEVFWLNHGTTVPMALGAVPGAFLTGLIRKWNNIPHKVGGRLLSVMPAAMLAAAGCGWMYEMARDDILLNQTRCPVCLELRLTAQLLFFGVVTPTAISISGSHSYLATLSYRLPDPLTKKYFSWIGTMLRKGKGLLGACAAAHVISAAFLLHQTREEWTNVNRKLYHELNEQSPVTEAAKRGEMKSILR